MVGLFRCGFLLGGLVKLVNAFVLGVLGLIVIMLFDRWVWVFCLAVWVGFVWLCIGWDEWLGLVGGLFVCYGWFACCFVW